VCQHATFLEVPSLQRLVFLLAEIDDWMAGSTLITMKVISTLREGFARAVRCLMDGCPKPHGLAFLAVLLLGFAGGRARAEIIFQDFFTQPAGNIASSSPWINVEGYGWQVGGNNSQVALDGQGHIYNSASNATVAAGIALIPIGPHGSMTASALMQIPAGSTESADLGFGTNNLFLTSAASGSGPWIKVMGNGTVSLYGGPAQDNVTTAVNAFTNTGSPVQFFLSYDAFLGTATVGSIAGGATNVIFNQTPVINDAIFVTPNYLIVQFSTNLTTPTARWMSDVSVDWYPRPQPMLTLPATIMTNISVGTPGTNDIQLIQTALNRAAGSGVASEVLFSSGATYVLTNSSTTGQVPLTLSGATNVLVNGNGCRILIKNPRIGFLDVSQCTNVIVEGFTVDYDPLPFTQGTITQNFYTQTQGPPESAIEVMIDAGYPSPTNANYLDSNAQRWGTVMNPSEPGRGADDSLTICNYTNVVQTNVNGAYKVLMPFHGQTATLAPGSRWCMISRWNNSMVFNAAKSYQVTFLNNTNYAGAGASYTATYTPLVCEVNCQVQLGPPPAGATAPRCRTSNADGGLMVESRIGPWVQGCNFTGLSDDVANACVNPFVPLTLPSGPQVTIGLGGYSSGTTTTLNAFQLQVGDQMLFFDASNGVVFDEAYVLGVSLPDATFDHAIANIDANTLLFDITLNTSAVYLDNQFSNSRIHGIYARADNMLIAHNNVSGMGLSAISAFPALDLSTPNSFLPTNVVIMDNVLSDCSFSQEALSNSIPTQEPAYALVELHKTADGTDYVPTGFEISGIRILYNAFLDWRRAPLSLHNATGVSVIGNYFGPPLTNGNYVPAASNLIADLWASDYPALLFSNNVNATGIADSKAISEDGSAVAIVGAFQAPAGPRLAAVLSGSNLVVNWVSPSPGFVLEQASRLGSGSNNWVLCTNTPVLQGASNVVTLPLAPGDLSLFLRARQR